jgi:hypothetical protein
MESKSASLTSLVEAVDSSNQCLFTPGSAGIELRLTRHRIKGLRVPYWTHLLDHQFPFSEFPEGGGVRAPVASRTERRLMAEGTSQW